MRRDLLWGADESRAPNGNRTTRFLDRPDRGPIPTPNGLVPFTTYKCTLSQATKFTGIASLGIGCGSVGPVGLS